MKRISLCVLGVMAVAISAPAQAQVYEERRQEVVTDPIEKPLLAAPNAAMARDATVIKIIRNPDAGEEVTAADFTYEVLRRGPGRMVCYDLTGFPGERPWSVECTSSDANLPRIMQNRAFAEMGAKATPLLGQDDPRRAGLPVLSSSGTGGIRDLVVAAGKDGTRELSEVGSIWYNLRGDSQDTAIWHTFIAMPNLTGEQVGLPEVRDAGGAWLMFAGTPEAHIMIGGR
ncbi:MAG: hypothetical protein F4Y45_17145 [Acidobacteria bacterium]|nr:hypothetical protein [Acidobacteriota bacterium]MXZ70178.1 hypothetical protein [Acidobacteriota bacterium]MYD71490.1 hypothetical protein [Acidobacteriota bacterium]